MNGSSGEIEHLKSQINQEEQLRQAVEQSYLELLATSKELEKRMNMIDEESNEWKTRFENQEEMNRQYTKQIAMLEKKLEETKYRSKNIKSKLMIENNNEANPERIKELKEGKESLENQLRDYAWRIDQENKAYHKANEERKEVHQELVETRDQITKAKNEKLSRTSILSNEMPSVARRKSVYHPTNNQSSPSLFLPSISNTSYEQQNEYSGSSRKSDYQTAPLDLRRKSYRSKLN